MSLSIDRLVDARRKNLRRLADQHGATRLSEMLGHKSATMTQDLYGHLFPDRLDAVADAMDAARTRALEGCPLTDVS